MPLAHLPYRRVVRRQAEQVHGHNDPGDEVRLPLDEPHRLLELRGVEVERALVDVDEHGRRAQERRRLPAREEREVGHEHRIARPDAPRHEGELQGVRAVRARHAVPGADVAGEAGLQLSHLRAADVAAMLQHAGDARVDTVFQRGVLRAKIPELHHLPSTSDTMDSYSRSISSSRSLGILRWRMVPPEAMNSCGSSSFSNALTSMSTSVL